MSTHNICLYEEVDKNYTGCNLKTAELPECALIGACAVIRSNTVIYMEKYIGLTDLLHYYWINYFSKSMGSFSGTFTTKQNDKYTKNKYKNK